MKNEMKLSFLSVSQNERFARAAIGAFVSQLDPTLDELMEIKTVVSEAVTNAIIHGYEGETNHYISIECFIDEGEVELIVKDEGVGITDIDTVREPLYTSKPQLERSGMGFTIMESFMDAVTVQSAPEQGTIVSMKKQLSKVKTVCN